MAGSGHLWLALSPIHQTLSALRFFVCLACTFQFAFMRDPAVIHLIDYLTTTSKSGKWVHSPLPESPTLQSYDGYLSLPVLTRKAYPG